MRLAGRISDWNDEKGYGFVEPNGGGERAFVHINEFQRGSRRPVAGDLISYLPGKDSRGRIQAREIRHAGQKIEPKRQPSRLPRMIIGIASLVAIFGVAATGMMPHFLAGVYLLLGVTSYLMYGSDKAAAERGASRTPENNLHLVDFLGGWPGALIAQQKFRHKTMKKSYQFVFWLTVAFNIAGMWWLVSSGTASGIARSFSG